MGWFRGNNKGGRMRFAMMGMVLGLVSGVWAEVTIHVAPNAPAGGDGRRRSPYATLEQARDHIRAARKEGLIARDEPVTVLLEPGVHTLTQSFELTREDGGSEAAPVVYRAAKRGRARLRGGLTLPADAFQPVTNGAVLNRLDPAVREHIRVCDLTSRVPGGFEPFKNAYSGTPAAPWLYHNRKPLTLARRPNADAPQGGWAGFTKAVETGKPIPDSPDPALRKPRPGSFEFADPRPARWNLEEGVWLMGYWTHDWSGEVIRIASYDPDKKVIALAAPHGYGIAAGTWGSAVRRFFALNLMEELDAPGEWYLDRTSKQLYVYPEGETEEGGEWVLATLTQPMLAVSDAAHIRVLDLAFEYSHCAGVVIILKNSEQVEVAGCVVANHAGSGISVSGRANTVRSCDLYQLGKAGLSLNGGDRKKLIAAKNLAVNNHIHHYGLFQRTYAAGIALGGCGQIARNNCIHDAPHNAVLYGGNEHLLELNEVYRVVMETGDAGAFYTGRDWTSQGNVLRHNFVHTLGRGDAKHVNTMGFYLDDCDCGDRIEGNVFWRAGRAIMIGGGRDNPVINNLIVECPIGLHIDSRGMTWKYWNNTNDPNWRLDAKAQEFDYRNPPWSVRYPKLASIMDECPREPLNNPARRNVFVDCVDTCSFGGKVMDLLHKMELEDNLIVNTVGTNRVGKLREGINKGFRTVSGTPDKPFDPGFEDAPNGNFALRRNARLFTELPAFERIPFERIGLYTDTFRRKLPRR